MWRSPPPATSRPTSRHLRFLDFLKRRWNIQGLLSRFRVALQRIARLSHAASWVVYGAIGSVTTLLCIVGLSHPVQSVAPADVEIASESGAPAVLVQTMQPSTLMEEGRSLYDQGRYAEAATALEQATQMYRNQNQPLWEAIALSNLSLTYQDLGQWPQADAAIASSLELLAPLDRPLIEAQALDVKGQLQFALGQFEAAINTWEQVGEYYESQDQPEIQTQNIVNRASALQALGFYRRAIDLLEAHRNEIQDLSPSLVQATALRSLGDAYQVTGYLDKADDVLQQSLAIAQQLQDWTELASVYLSLGNVLYSKGVSPTFSNAQETLEQAADAYRRAAESPLAATQVQAQLNLLKVAIALNNIGEINTVASTLGDRLNRLPANRTTLFAHINFVESLIALVEEDGFSAVQVARIDQHLTTAYEQAQALGDPRGAAFALGTFGKFYETIGSLDQSQEMSEEALLLAQQINATDMTYLWQWQLGRVHKAKGDREKAIASYSSAIDTLQLLRRDLVSVNPDVQFSFRDSIEPLHRELVSLLLDPDVDPSPAELEKARKTIESLQLAELDNFFREACLNASEVQIDEVDRRAAVIYPIILEDRLEVILSLPEEAIAPHSETDLSATESENINSEVSTYTDGSDAEGSGQLLQRHTTFLDGGSNEIEGVAEQLSFFLRSPTSQRRVPALAQQLYSYVIEPFEADLQAGEVKTLVFVLDGVLRNVPMAALYDGDQYLIEKYSVALAPSLQLVESSPLQSKELNILLGGISESRQDFSPLPQVERELTELEALVPESRQLLNSEFTDEALQQAINAVPFPVVHLATHGQFSSNLEETFILTWEDRLDINELNQLLQNTELGRRQPIEMLVLSACQTANGDDRAALGLAGVAVRAGARSTVATLWNFQDEVAPLMMNRFYQELQDDSVTKAEALRRAQLEILENPNYSDPYYWSLIVLVGNWL